MQESNEMESLSTNSVMSSYSMKESNKIKAVSTNTTSNSYSMKESYEMNAGSTNSTSNSKMNEVMEVKDKYVKTDIVTSEMSESLKSKDLMCIICNDSYQTFNTLVSHSCHPFRCRLCHIIFQFDFQFKRHKCGPGDTGADNSDYSIETNKFFPCDTSGYKVGPFEMLSDDEFIPCLKDDNDLSGPQNHELIKHGSVLCDTGDDINLSHIDKLKGSCQNDDNESTAQSLNVPLCNFLCDTGDNDINLSQIDELKGSCDTCDDKESAAQSQNARICKFCDASFKTWSLLWRHRPFCDQRKLKLCIICSRAMHPSSKRTYCRRCSISIIGKAKKSYSLRYKNSSVNRLSSSNMPFQLVISDSVSKDCGNGTWPQKDAVPISHSVDNKSDQCPTDCINSGLLINSSDDCSESDIEEKNRLKSTELQVEPLEMLTDSSGVENIKNTKNKEVVNEISWSNNANLSPGFVGKPVTTENCVEIKKVILPKIEANSKYTNGGSEKCHKTNLSDVRNGEAVLDEPPRKRKQKTKEGFIISKQQLPASKRQITGKHLIVDNLTKSLPEPQISVIKYLNSKPVIESKSHAVLHKSTIKKWFVQSSKVENLSVGQKRSKPENSNEAKNTSSLEIHSKPCNIKNLSDVDIMKSNAIELTESKVVKKSKKVRKSMNRKDQFNDTSAGNLSSFYAKRETDSSVVTESELICRPLKMKQDIKMQSDKILGSLETIFSGNFTKHDNSILNKVSRKRNLSEKSVDKNETGQQSKSKVKHDCIEKGYKMHTKSTKIAEKQENVLNTGSNESFDHCKNHVNSEKQKTLNIKKALSNTKLKNECLSADFVSKQKNIKAISFYKETKECEKQLNKKPAILETSVSHITDNLANVESDIKNRQREKYLVKGNKDVIKPLVIGRKFKHSSRSKARKLQKISVKRIAVHTIEDREKITCPEAERSCEISATPETFVSGSTTVKVPSIMNNTLHKDKSSTESEVKDTKVINSNCFVAQDKGQTEKKEVESEFVTNVLSIQTLIKSLPDVNSGVLLQSGSNLVCAKCGKLFKQLVPGCVHYSLCKVIKPKKKLVSLNDVRFICTACNSVFFTQISELMLHKTLCTVLPVRMSIFSEDYFQLRSIKDSVKHYSSSCIYWCPKCSYKCISSILFKNHPCAKRLQHMQSCSVVIQTLSKLDIWNGTLLIFECSMCKQVFFDDFIFRKHLKKHPPAYPETIKPLYLYPKPTTKGVGIHIKTEPLDYQPSSSCNTEGNSHSQNYVATEPSSTTSGMHTCLPSTVFNNSHLPSTGNSLLPKDKAVVREFNERFCECEKSTMSRQDEKPCTQCLINLVVSRDELNRNMMNEDNKLNKSVPLQSDLSPSVLSATVPLVEPKQEKYVDLDIFASSPSASAQFSNVTSHKEVDLACKTLEFPNSFNELSQPTPPATPIDISINYLTRYDKSKTIHGWARISSEVNVNNSVALNERCIDRFYCGKCFADDEDVNSFVNHLLTEHSFENCCEINLMYISS